MIGVFDFLCDLFLLHSPKRGGRGGRGSRVVILGSCFQILMKQPSAAVCGVESCLRQTKRTKNRKCTKDMRRRGSVYEEWVQIQIVIPPLPPWLITQFELRV
jgi:hypothetical protein